MNQTAKIPMFTLTAHDREDLEAVMAEILKSFREKHRTVVIVAFDNQIDIAVQLALMVKND